MPTSRRNFIKSTGISLLAFGALKQDVLAQALSDSGLRDVFDGKFDVGAMINTISLLRNDRELLNIIERDFSAISSENAFKWENIHPTDTHWTWEYSDLYVEFGERHGLTVHGHPLIWHSQLPAGLFRGEKGERIGRQPLLSKLKEHVSTVVGRYQSRVQVWDVVNEAFDDEGVWVLNPWYKIIGSDYITAAFRAARQASPDATLVYNDYNLWKPKKQKAVIDLIRKMKKQGAPIDAVGIQGHVGLEDPDLSEIDSCIKAFSEEGLSTYISEVDVDVLPQPDSKLLPKYSEALDPYKEGLPESVSQKLADRYSDLFRVFVENSDVIKGVTLWGVTDDQSWKNEFPVPGRTNYPLLYDRSNNPKAAYHALMAMG